MCLNFIFASRITPLWLGRLFSLSLDWTRQSINLVISTAGRNPAEILALFRHKKSKIRLIATKTCHADHLGCHGRIHINYRDQALKKLAILVLAAVLSAPAFSATAVNARTAQPGAGAMFIDAVLVRPLGVVATALGAVTWVVSLPFSALGGNVGEAADMLIKAPAVYTFKRPLGHNE